MNKVPKRMDYGTIKTVEKQYNHRAPMKQR